MDIVSREVRSRMMAAVRTKNTCLEKIVCSEMKKRGVVFKKHYKFLPGTPDVVSIQNRKVVFIDGDFWHGYRYPAWKNKIKSRFWREKIETNRRRDRRNFQRLRRSGWQVLRVWGHELKGQPDKTLTRIYEFLSV
jgi:DNA mismatch endonuclease, patch repair protein